MTGTAAVPTASVSSATETSTATATPASTESPTPTLVASPTQGVIAVRQRVTPTLSPPAGVYVTGVNIVPLSAKSTQPPDFSATFLNTTGQPRTVRWFVKVYVPDQPQSFGETTKVDTEIQPGTTQVKSFSDWKTTTFFGCLWFIARVFWVDQNSQVVEFMKPDGSSPAKGFTVCP